MMRKKYETGHDKKREAGLRDVVKNRFAVMAYDNRRYHHIDGVIRFQSGEFGLIEYRTRNHDWGKYKTIWISQDKVASAVGHMKTGLSFTFCVATFDKFGLFLTRDPNEWAGLSRAYSGRHNVRDADDVELLIEIPINRFQVFDMSEKERKTIWN